MSSALTYLSSLANQATASISQLTTDLKGLSKTVTLANATLLGAQVTGLAGLSWSVQNVYSYYVGSPNRSKEAGAARQQIESLKRLLCKGTPIDAAVEVPEKKLLKEVSSAGPSSLELVRPDATITTVEALDTELRAVLGELHHIRHIDGANEVISSLTWLLETAKAKRSEYGKILQDAKDLLKGAIAPIVAHLDMFRQKGDDAVHKQASSLQKKLEDLVCGNKHRVENPLDTFQSGQDLKVTIENVQQALAAATRQEPASVVFKIDTGSATTKGSLLEAVAKTFISRNSWLKAFVQFSQIKQQLLRYATSQLGEGNLPALQEEEDYPEGFKAAHAALVTAAKVVQTEDQLNALSPIETHLALTAVRRAIAAYNSFLGEEVPARLSTIEQPDQTLTAQVDHARSTYCAYTDGLGEIYSNLIDQLDGFLNEAHEAGFSEAAQKPLREARQKVRDAKSEDRMQGVGAMPTREKPRNWPREEQLASLLEELSQACQSVTPDGNIPNLREEIEHGAQPSLLQTLQGLLGIGGLDEFLRLDQDLKEKNEEGDLDVVPSNAIKEQVKRLDAGLTQLMEQLPAIESAAQTRVQQLTAGYRYRQWLPALVGIAGGAFIGGIPHLLPHLQYGYQLTERLITSISTA